MNRPIPKDHAPEDDFRSDEGLDDTEAGAIGHAEDGDHNQDGDAGRLPEPPTVKDSTSARRERTAAYPSVARRLAERKPRISQAKPVQPGVFKAANQPGPTTEDRAEADPRTQASPAHSPRPEVAPLATGEPVPPPPPDDPKPIWRATFPLIAGFLAMIVLFGGLGIWSVRAQIAGAVVANGMVQVESNRQVVQHPDGGVVGEILVKDSDVVKQGDVLIRLDGKRLQSELSVIEGQLREIAARKARLIAERDGSDAIDFAPHLQLDASANASTAEAVARLVRGETTLFRARLDSLAQEQNLLQEQNRQIDNRIRGINAQLEAMRAQAELLSKETEDQQRLLEQQLTQASRVSELLREEANLFGQIGRLEAEVAELRGQAASNDIALLQLRTRRREEAVTLLRDMQFREIELTQRAIVLQDTLSRQDIRAPVDGIVYGMEVFARQSVVQPAQRLMYIIPQDQPMVVSARVESINVDEVYVGQEASLRFPAFDQREVPEMTGVVSRISADVLTDDVTGMTYYSVEILPLQEELEKLGEHVLLPGMPVEGFIKTGDRTPLTYLLQPMTSFFSKAFRE